MDRRSVTRGIADVICFILRLLHYCSSCAANGCHK